jgi:AsmA protein
MIPTQTRSGPIVCLLCYACVVGAVVGLPIAVDRTTSLDVIYGRGSPPSRATSFIVAEPVHLLSALPLSMGKGSLYGANPEVVGTSGTVSQLNADGAAFTLDFSNSIPDAGDAPTPRLSPLLAQLAEFNVGRLILRQAKLNVILPNATQFSLTDITGEITAGRGTSFSAKGLASYNGRRVSFEASWRKAADLASPQGMPVTLVMKGDIFEASFDGRLGIDGGARFKGKSHLRVHKLRSLARWLGLPESIGVGLNSASLSSPVEWTAKQLSFPDATVTVGSNEGNGALMLSLKGTRPSIDGTLDFHRFDATNYIAAAAQNGTQDEQAAAGGKHAPPLMTLFDADIRVSATKVVVPFFETGRGAATVALKQGKLLADLAEIEIEGGSAGGQVVYDLNSETPRLAFKTKFTGVDPGRIFTHALQRNPLLGRADLLLEGNATGTTATEMLSTLGGKGSIKLVDSGKLGLDLKSLIYAASQAEQVTWTAAGKGTTPLDELSARFQIAHGSVAIDSLQAKSGATSYLGVGTVNMSQRVLDLHLAAGDNATSESPIASRDVLQVRGDWQSPTIELMRNALQTTSGTPAPSPPPDRF